MDKISLILMAVMMAAVIVLWAPNILAFNRGKVLRNIALWLAIFTGLTLVYRNFGPDSPHPLFSGPAIGMRRGPTPDNAADTGTSNDNHADGRGYTPPSE